MKTVVFELYYAVLVFRCHIFNVFSVAFKKVETFLAVSSCTWIRYDHMKLVISRLRLQYCVEFLWPIKDTRSRWLVLRFILSFVSSLLLVYCILDGNDSYFWLFKLILRLHCIDFMVCVFIACQQFDSSANGILCWLDLYIVWYCWREPTINSTPQQGPWHSKMSDTQHQPSSLVKSVCCAESGSGAVRSYTHSLCNDVLRRSVTVERCNKCSRARFVVQLHDCSSARPHVGSESASILFEFILIQYYEITFTYSIRYVLHWTIYCHTNT